MEGDFCPLGTRLLVAGALGPLVSATDEENTCVLKLMTGVPAIAQQGRFIDFPGTRAAAAGGMVVFETCFP